MYVNKCIKCGREFETKNPKRVICPDCLYPDKKMMISPSSDSETAQTTSASVQEQPLNGYSAGGTEEPPRYYSAGGDPEPQRYNNRNQRSYNNQSGYNRNNYNNRQNYNRNQGGYNRQGYNNNRSQGGYNNRNQRPGFNNRRPQGGNFNRNNFKRQQKKAPKQLLVSKEQLEQIEKLYKAMLPLPNPDCHEVIGEKIGLEPRKVFFGINLVRQKMMLPKLPEPSPLTLNEIPLKFWKT